MHPHRTGRLLSVAALAVVLAGTGAACQSGQSTAPETGSQHNEEPGDGGAADQTDDGGVERGGAERNGGAGAESGGDGMPSQDGQRAGNVILIVGDGMGIAHRELIRLTTVGHEGQLAMNELTFQGWTQTEPADPDRPVTDSAAAATALAAGVRTETGAVGVDPEGNTLPTLLEQAAEAGMATGLVTTAEVTDATPTAFAAHVPDRDQHHEIARQYVEETEVDVILGGGAEVWNGDATAGQANLVERAEALGYRRVGDGEQLAQAQHELAAAAGGRLLGLFAPGPMFTDLDHAEPRYDPAVPLPVLASAALEVLSPDPDGFFLLIEEEGIDAMAHRGNAAEMIEAGRALDEAVTVARNFLEDHPDTLLVVAGDHETGGLAVESIDTDIDPETAEQERDVNGPFTVAGTNLMFDVEWTSGGHTAAATPASAQGPGAERMVDVRHLTDLHDLVAQAMALDDD